MSLERDGRRNMKRTLVSILLSFLIVFGCMTAEAAGTGEKIRQIVLMSNAILVLREDGRVVPIPMEPPGDNYREYMCSEEALKAVGYKETWCFKNGTWLPCHID